jgi:hypothetical protein
MKKLILGFALIAVTATAADLRSVVDQLRADKATPVAVVKAIEAGQPTPLRDYLAAPTATSNIVTVAVVNRAADLVFIEQDLAGYATARGYSPTNSLAAIYAVYAGLITSAATAEEQADLNLEWRTVQNSKAVISQMGGDYSGVVSTVTTNTEAVVTQKRWQVLGLPAEPNNNDLEGVMR